MNQAGETIDVWVVEKRFVDKGNRDWFIHSVHQREHNAKATYKLQLAINTESRIRPATLTFKEASDES